MIVARSHAVETIEGEGMVVRRALPNSEFRMVDPFLLLDHMGPKDFGPGEGRGAPDHPHRGFETVTYCLEGRLQHKDSQGNVGDLGPGDIQWMTAGAGVVHSEMPHPDLQETGGRMHGLQLWINLPAKNKMMAPRYQDIRAQEIPTAELDGARVRVVAGEFGGVSAHIDTITPITYLHATVTKSVTLPVPGGHQAMLYVLSGQGSVDGDDVAESDTLLVDGDVHVEGELDVLLVTGQPIGEPVMQWGPFVMTNRQEIVQAVRDYQEGRLGSIG